MKVRYVVMAIILVIGSMIAMKEIKTNSEEKEYAKSMESTFIRFIELNFKNVESVTITNSKQVQTGAILFEGYINGDKSLQVGAISPIHSNEIYGLTFDEIVTQYLINGPTSLKKID